MVGWFSSDGYFALESVSTISDHVEVSWLPRWARLGYPAFLRLASSALTAASLPPAQSLYGAKVQAHASHQDYLEIKWAQPPIFLVDLRALADS